MYSADRRLLLETASAITIVVPLILPLLTAYNINLTQFGIIMVLNLMIGLLTPPFGLVLFVISKIGHISIGPLLQGTGSVAGRAACCTASGNFYPTAEPVVPDYAGNERLIIRRKMRKR